MDVIVTTPKKQSKIAAQEAENCKVAGGGRYFRIFKKRPKNLFVGDRVFYVEDGYVRGFLTVRSISNNDNNICGTSGQDYGSGTRIEMDAASWKWIKPVPMKGFQGWRYSNIDSYMEVGNWLDPMPEIIF